MKKYVLEVVVFICGASVMILELIASRILAPFIGTSTYVWTSLIGVIMTSLSIGYWLGGKLADKLLKSSILSMIIFTSGIIVGVITFTNIGILSLVTKHILDYRISSIISTVILFFIPSLLLGMVSPYAVKLKMVNCEKTGATIGSLYAISTMGSIVGTFAAGFILIPTMGTQRILLLTSVILIITSQILGYKEIFKQSLFAAGVFFCFMFYPGISANILNRSDLIDVDTQYSRIWIYDSEYINKKVRVMQIGNEFSSAMYNDEPNNLVFDYLKFYRLAEHFNSNFKTSLMIGGAAYSYPKFYLQRYPNSTIDVVEIDPKVTSLAKNYFELKENPRLKIFHQDGRVFLNTRNNKYDVILGDAFRSYSVPYQLTTKEAAQRMFDLLNENGIVLINVIASIEGESGKFLRAEYSTFKSIFPQVYIFPVTEKNDALKTQNIMLVALKSEEKPMFESQDEEIRNYLSNLWVKDITLDMPTITDEYAPVEYYTSKVATD